MSQIGTKSRHVVEVDVPDVQKRRMPSKHYVYIIHVTWSDNTRTVIYRRYSRFFDFQNNLLDKFPLEAGLLDPSKRIIPFLPGKKYFGRSHIREVAVKRLQPIEEYCKTLIKLPDNISKDEDLNDFFESEPDDLNPNTGQEEKKPKNIEKISAPKLAEEYIVVADYSKEDKWDLDLQAGMVVEVVEKSESGWWFVTMADKQGWVPSTFMKRKDGQQENSNQKLMPGYEEKYVATERYSPQAEDEVGLETGAVVDVLEKTLDGWWRIRFQGKEGWAPATYLMKADKAHIQQGARQSGVQIVGTLSDISELLKESKSPAAELKTKKKSRTIERGGSIRPPPRQNSIKNIQMDVEARTGDLPVRRFVTIADFQDTVGDGISFRRGENVEVVEKNDGGWWYVQIGEREGWIPATYVKEASKVEEEVSQDVYYADVPGPSDEDSDDDYEVPNAPYDTNIEQQKSAKPLPKVPSSKQSVISGAAGLANALKAKLASKTSDGGKPKPSPTPPQKPTHSNLPQTQIQTPPHPEIKVQGPSSNKIDRPCITPPEPPTGRKSPSESKSLSSEDRKSPLIPVVPGGRKSPVRPDPPAKKTALKPKMSQQPTGRISPSRPDPPVKFKKPPVTEKPQEDNDLSNALKNRLRKVEKDSPSEIKPVNVVADSSENEASGLANVLKAKFESRQSNAVTNNSENETSSLANVLKAKFESRQSNIPQAEDNVKNEDSKNHASKKPLVPPGKLKPKPNFLKETDGQSANKPNVPPKALKPAVPIKQKSTDSASDLNSILAAKLEARKASSDASGSGLEKRRKSEDNILCGKPTVAIKPSNGPARALKPQISTKPVNDEETSVASTTAALKSKFENAGLFGGGMKQNIPVKPKKETEDNAIRKNIAKPNLPNKPAVQEKRSVDIKPVASATKSSPAQNTDKDVFVTVSDFYAENEGEVSFESGVVVQVLDKADTGWWFVSVNGEEGWAPESYLEESN